MTKKTVLIIIGYLLLAALVYILMHFTGRLSPQLWLPDNQDYMDASSQEILRNLPIKIEEKQTNFGMAKTYTTDQRANVVYQLPANPLLKAKYCPNITDIEPLLPSTCKRVGWFQGSPIYAINRRLPSSATEFFVNLGGAFIFVKSSDDSGTSPDYLKAFTRVSDSQQSDYFAQNQALVSKAQAEIDAEKAVADKQSSEVYLKLGFTPALPSSLPTGWQRADRPIEINGPDIDHPQLVSMVFTDKKEEQFVTYHSGKLSDFSLGTGCGPSPGYSMEVLACKKVPETDYYEAEQYDELRDYIRYLYRPVGDSLVITHMSITSKNGEYPRPTSEMLQTQNTITESAQPVPLSALQGSVYARVYY